MKFIHYTFLLLSCFAIGCFAPSSVYQTSPSPVKFQFEEGSKVIKKTYCTSLEKTKDGKFLFKRYYPTTSVLTEQISFWDKEMEVKHGKAINYYDDGTFWKSITYKNNIANGEAKINNSTGNFKDGYKFGNWQTFDDGIKVHSINYNEKGQIHGQDTSWSDEGKLASIRIYKNGKEIKEEIFIEDVGFKFEIVEVMPRFPNKDCDKIENDSLKKVCADKALLMQIYNNIRYPSFARENGIEGTALISFVVEKDGSIAEVKALNGVCDEIKAVCLEIVNGFPDFNPGYQNGEPVRVQFNLPVRFRLE